MDDGLNLYKIFVTILEVVPIVAVPSSITKSSMGIYGNDFNIDSNLVIFNSLDRQQALSDHTHLIDRLQYAF